MYDDRLKELHRLRVDVSKAEAELFRIEGALSEVPLYIAYSQAKRLLSDAKSAAENYEASVKDQVILDGAGPGKLDDHITVKVKTTLRVTDVVKAIKWAIAKEFDDLDKKPDEGATFLNLNESAILQAYKAFIAMPNLAGSFPFDAITEETRFTVALSSDLSGVE